MAICKICGRPMPIGQTVHRSCLERTTNELQEHFCTEKCRHPLNCDEDTLAEHCASCRLNQLATLCKEAFA